MGHFAMARACGVRVLQFSIGFGPALAGWTSPRTGTRYQLALVPLGGFVKMLDEREAPVAPQDLAEAFNRKPLRMRAAVVAAGPLANLVLAVLLYSAVHWIGVNEAQALLAHPPEGSLAAKAGLVGGERVLRAGFAGEPLHPVRSFEDLRWWLTRAALGGQRLQLDYHLPQEGAERSLVLPLHTVDVRHADARMFQAIGLAAPMAPPRIGDVLPDSAAQAAGLRPGDLVLEVDGEPMRDAQQLRDRIRDSGVLRAPSVQQWQIAREGVPRVLPVTPQQVQHEGVNIGRVGAMIGGEPAWVRVRYGAIEGLEKAVVKTWEVSVLSLRMMGNIVMGAASLRNLSGPITIADYAGKSAAQGPEAYLGFLALISVSLGVLNLLPIPVLDGGHLMYYGWEAITGRAVSEAWMAGLQRAGFVVLLAMMSVALFNDLSRLLS